MFTYIINRVEWYAYSVAWTGSCHADEKALCLAVYLSHPTVTKGAFCVFYASRYRRCKSVTGGLLYEE